MAAESRPEGHTSTSDSHVNVAGGVLISAAGLLTRAGVGSLRAPSEWVGYARPAHMAYDEDLANRLRELLADEDAIAEKKMFGGLAFLLHGNMSVSASRNGGLLVRIDPADTDAAIARPHVALMEMGGRTMDGWITVAPEGVKTKRQLAGWVKRSVAYVKTLPPK
jgi:TfoX/Sxy family transcriptional regulator of competence genes